MDMRVCWSFPCYLSWTLGSSSKCSQFKYYIVRYSSELADLLPLPYSQERSTHYSDRFHNFTVIFPRCYKDVHVNSFSPNSVPVECFSLTYDLSGFKSRIIRHILTIGSFWIDFLYALIFLSFLLQLHAP